MPAQSLREFVASTADQARSDGPFELETEHLLQIHVAGEVWIKSGAMVAYRGDIKFEREGMLEGGIGQFLKKAVSGEGASLMRAKGRGDVYAADKGKRIVLLDLRNEAIVVNGSDILAFSTTLSHKVTMMRKIAAMASGGLFNVRVEGSGLLAITTHQRAVALRVAPGQPVCTDPQATVAWAANLSPELKTDIQWKSLIGRGSGESFQMRFEGDGWVLVQPYEESAMQHG